jgi:hypothetical protein
MANNGWPAANSNPKNQSHLEWEGNHRDMAQDPAEGGRKSDVWAGRRIVAVADGKTVVRPSIKDRCSSRLPFKRIQTKNSNKPGF